MGLPSVSHASWAGGSEQSSKKWFCGEKSSIRRRLKSVTLTSTVLSGIGSLRDKSRLRPQAVYKLLVHVFECVCLTTGTWLVNLYMCALWMRV